VSFLTIGAAVFLVVPFGELRRILFHRPSLHPVANRGRTARGRRACRRVACPVGVDDPDDAGQGPLEWLLQASHTLPPGRLAPAVDEALRRIGARSSLVYVVDHDQRSLHPLPMDGAEQGAFDVDGTTGGRAFMLEQTVTIPTDDGVRQWVPLLDGTARLGVVSVDLDAEAADDPAMARLIERCVSLAAELLVTKSQYTDEIECVRRRQAMSLEAELQRCTLPPVALLTPSVAVAGLLLPAYEVAGDSFDYALNEDRLEVAIIDSVGHELESSVISHLVYGSLRNSRRNRIELAEAYARAGAAVARVFPDIRFATAAFGHLDLGSGSFRWVSAGHPPPLLVRGGKVTGEAPTKPALPIGLGGTDPTVNEVALERGDHVFLYTDGATEGGEPGGPRFGLDRLVDLLGRSLLDGLPPAETVRRLVQAVFAHSAYRLQDDTTMMLIEYRGAPGD
jgi:serine phosphatase RsbU (regulator of sigma subunit)